MVPHLYSLWSKLTAIETIIIIKKKCRCIVQKKAHSNEGVNWEKNTEFFFLWIN